MASDGRPRKRLKNNLATVIKHEQSSLPQDVGRMPLSRSNSYFDLDFTLKRVFKKQSFRPLQREVIEASLDGHDVFLQAATSFGKSLCFQLPAVIDHGSEWQVWDTNTISDEASHHRHLSLTFLDDIESACLNSTTPQSEKQKILKDLATGHPLTRLLYLTPETCTLDHIRRHLTVVHEQKELARIAVDEAHCISEWGHDFRPAFKELKWFRQQFADVPIICLTATATAKIRKDVISTLGLVENKMKIFAMTTSRQNLHYEVRFKSDDVDVFDDFLPWLQHVYRRRSENAQRREELESKKERLDNVPGIIYTLFRKDCEGIALRLRNSGIGARPYHAGLSNEERRDTLSRWVDNEQGYDIIVATTAFGMGIDKENVRFVVHWQLPKSFEGFYQEAGRAGRDGKASVCIMYYSREDRDRAINMLCRDKKERGNLEARMRSLKELTQYCEDTDTCRHQMICRYFGEAAKPPCDYACDWHKDAKALKKAKNRDLMSEEWVSTQAAEGCFDTGFESYDGYD